MKLATVLIVTGLVCATALATEPAHRTLTFGERVAAQKAIEQVYWDRRIWPKENPQPKPPMSTVMSDDLVRAKVEDYLKKSNALETWWHRPITGEQLQAETDRMAKDTRDPAVLRELFVALRNDPVVIAETLARQQLADRLIRNWYDHDTRIHAAARAKAETALNACSSVDCLKSMSGEYRESILRPRTSPAEGERESDRRRVLTLDSEDWNQALDRLATKFGTTSKLIPSGRLSRLEDTADSFVITAILSQQRDEVITATVAWPKQPFDDWWAAARVSEALDGVDKPNRFVLPAISSSPCVINTWSSMRQEFPDPRDGHTAVWTGAEMIVWGGENLNRMNSGARYDPSTDSWAATSRGANLPDARYNHTAVWTGTEMIVWGGSGGNGLLNSGARYDPTADRWRPTSRGTGVPAERVWHTAVWTGAEMIVWGGGTVDGDTNTGGRYDPSTDRWTPTTEDDGNLPDARRFHSAVWTGAEMIVWGGTYGTSNDQGGQRYLRSGGRYNPSTDSWTPTSTGVFVPSERILHTAVWTGTEMIVWGGYVIVNSPNPFEPNSSIFFPTRGGRYDPSTDSWTPTSTAFNAPAGRTGQTAVWTGTEMLVWGGYNLYNLNDGARYAPSTNTWRAISRGPNAPTARGGHTTVWTGTELIVWGGSVGFYSYLSTGARYNPISDSWVPTSNGTTEPAARYGPTSVWTGSEMIVWGGESYDGRYTDYKSGGCYDPSTDSWRPTALGVSVPAGRYRPTSIWTGTEMIVWGGEIYNGTFIRFDTGGRYNPISDSWRPTSTGANVPSARNNHTAVWTGTKMIVWGGTAADGVTNTGGRYDPSTDAWLTTSTGPNVPAERDSHTAVWTGTEMIVWGGKINIYDYLNSGGRYDPLSDSWLPTAEGANLPGARAQHIAVWTGTQMIVWGGALFDIYSGWHFFNTGGRYDPTVDGWTATSVDTRVPNPRRFHSAVWTGTEMIVWGGVDFSNYFSSGGRYDPSVDAWTRTSTGANTPAPREEHTAVWTGTQMLVWGGWPLTSSGGRYCARNACVGCQAPIRPPPKVE